LIESAPIVAEATVAAVRRSAGHRLHADVAAGAGAVLDHEGLAEADLQPLGQHPRQRVLRAAGAEQHDDLDGLVGLQGLRQTQSRRQANSCAQAAVEEPSTVDHGRPFSSVSGAGMRLSLAGASVAALTENQDFHLRDCIVNFRVHKSIFEITNIGLPHYERVFHG